MVKPWERSVDEAFTYFDQKGYFQPHSLTEADTFSGVAPQRSPTPAGVEARGTW